MKCKNFFILMALVFFIFCCYCSKKGDECASPKVETIDGIPHVYNNKEPLKGELTLELEKLMEIDSLVIDKSQPPSISQFNHYKDRIYFFDANQFKIFIFDAGGKLLNQLEIKGQGPGEIERVTQFVLGAHNNDLWIPAETKVIRYDRDGKFLEEFKFQKTYRQMFINDENSFIGKYFINQNDLDKSKRSKLLCFMFNREEQILTKYFEGEGLGGLEVIGQHPNGRRMRVVFVMQNIVPDVVFEVDRDRQLIYIAKTAEYVVSVKTLKGDLQRVIHKVHPNRLLSEEDRKEIVGQQLFGQPDEIKKLMASNLPAQFCAILTVRALPNGYFMVHQITGASTFNIDIFDAEGRYIYRLKYPGKKEIPWMLIYPGEGSLGMVEQAGDRDIYCEYKIKNLTEIFGR